ncbi:hypothetical protein ACFLUJ_02800 [Chloroflexota bacterium]
MDIISIVGAVIGVYMALFAYLFGRLRRLRRLPPEVRHKMTATQRVLFLYGFYQVPSTDIKSTADHALSSFSNAWQEMENVFRQFNTNFEHRKKELQNAETNLAEIQQNIQDESERLRSLSQLTPDAAREVSATIQKSSRSSLRQQIIISAVFFVLGSVTTLGITLLAT